MMDIPSTNTDRNREIVLVTIDRLEKAILRVIEDDGGKPFRPASLIKRFGVNKDVASRVMIALQKQNKLAMAYAMPGPAPLRILARGARNSGCDPECVQVLDESIDEYERMLTEEVFDKTGLNTLVSTWIPEARAEMDITARQLVYRGVSLVKGVMADAALVSFVVHPSEQHPGVCSTAMIGGWIGMKRIRPHVPIRFIAHLKQGPGSNRGVFDPHSSEFFSHFMHKYSDSPLPIELQELPERTEYMLEDCGVGPRSSANVFVTELYPRNHPLAKHDPRTKSLRYFFAGIDVPVKTLILDVLVAKEVWVGTEPEVRVYDTAANGKADPNDPTRDIDIMPQADGSRCISMGTDIEQFRCAMIPQYAQMLNSVINAHGWSGSTFRGYRCQIEYPLYSSQVTLVFDPFRRA